MPFGSLSRRKSSETADDTESGLSIFPSRSAKIRSRSARVVLTKLLPELLLALAVRIQRGDGRH